MYIHGVSPPCWRNEATSCLLGFCSFTSVTMETRKSGWVGVARRCDKDIYILINMRSVILGALH